VLLYLCADLFLAVCAVLASIWGQSSALAAAVVLMLQNSLERECSCQNKGRVPDALAEISVAIFFLASGIYLLASSLQKVQTASHDAPLLWVAVLSVLFALAKVVLPGFVKGQVLVSMIRLRNEGTVMAIVFFLVACGVVLSSILTWQDTVLSLGFSVLVLYHSGDMALTALEELGQGEGIRRPGKED